MKSHAQCATIKYVNACNEALGGELGRKLDAIEEKRDRRHESVKEDLRRHGDDLIELKAEVAGLKVGLAMANDKLDRHDVKLDLHTATLEDQGRKLDLHTATLEDQGRKLDQHTATLEDQGRKLDLHTATLDEHGRKLDQHTATLDDQGRKLDQHTATLDGHGKKLDRILELLEAA